MCIRDRNQDGRFLAFNANAADLETGGTSEVTDVFVLDRQTGEVDRISTPTQSDQQPGSVAISNDGEVVSFVSSSALVPEDTNGTADVYVYLRSSEELQLLDLRLEETNVELRSISAVAMSDNGQFFVFVGSGDVDFQGALLNSSRVFRHDRLSQTNLEAAIVETETNGIDQVLAGSSNPSISADGRFVGFLSSAVAEGAAVRDFEQNTVSFPFEGADSFPGRGRTLGSMTLSADASAIVFSTRLEIAYDLAPRGQLIYHQQLGTAEQVLLEGTEIEPATADNESTGSKNGNSVSSDGRFVVFATRSSGYAQADTDEQHVVLADTLTGTRLLLTAGQSQAEGNVFSGAAAISASGSHVAFESSATSFANMTEVADDDNGAHDVFVYELATGRITHASKPNPTFIVASRAFRNPDLSADGRFLVFNSSRQNFSQADGTERVYRLEQTTEEVLLISKTLDNLPNDGRANRARISADGQTVAFVTESAVLLDQPGNDLLQTVFVWQQDTGRAEQVSLVAPAQFFGDPVALSGNGRFIAYPTRGIADAEQLSRLLLHDRFTDTTLVVESFDSPSSGGTVAIDQVVLSHDARHAGYRVIARGPIPSPFLAPPTGLFRADRFTAERIAVVGSLDTSSPRGRDPKYPAISGDGSAMVFTSADGLVSPDLNDLPDVFLARQNDVGGALFSAVLPSSRSATLNSPTTVFATVIATGDMTGCNLQLANEEAIDFSFQQIDLTSGAVVGGINSLFDLVSNTPAHLILQLTAAMPVSSQELVFDAWCATGQASNSTIGLNTLSFSASASATADIVALTASSENDGTMTVPSDGSFGFFSVATTNVGATDMISVEPLVSGVDGATALVCQTDPGGSCLANPVPVVTLEMVAAETATFGVFVRSSEGLMFDPARNRVRVEFADSAGLKRGRTSLAVR